MALSPAGADSIDFHAAARVGGPLAADGGALGFGRAGAGVIVRTGVPALETLSSESCGFVVDDLATVVHAHLLGFGAVKRLIAAPALVRAALTPALTSCVRTKGVLG